MMIAVYFFACLRGALGAERMIAIVEFPVTGDRTLVTGAARINAQGWRKAMRLREALCVGALISPRKRSEIVKGEQ